MTRHRMTLLTLSTVAAATLLGCESQLTQPLAPAARAEVRSAADTSPTSSAATARWSGDATAIAAKYLAWGRIDDEARWAPYLCRMPLGATARFSQSDDPRTHGSKLYTLYAKDPKAYADMPVSFGAKSPGLPRYTQVIVKEAWVPEPIKDWKDAGFGGWGKSRLRPAVRKGVAYGADKRSGLFLMFQLAKEQDRKGTDKGWVYATLKPDGITRTAGREVTKWKVTAAGRIGSCMECHVDADGKGGRLFGLNPEGKSAEDG